MNMLSIGVFALALATYIFFTNNWGKDIRTRTVDTFVIIVASLTFKLSDFSDTFILLLIVITALCFWYFRNVHSNKARNQ